MLGADRALQEIEQYPVKPDGGPQALPEEVGEVTDDKELGDPLWELRPDVPSSRPTWHDRVQDHSGILEGPCQEKSLLDRGNPILGKLACLFCLALPPQPVLV